MEQKMANKTELVVMSDGSYLKADPLKFMREFDNTLVMPVYASLIDEGKDDPSLSPDEALDTAATTWTDIEWGLR
jgi:hypothetical protein